MYKTAAARSGRARLSPGSSPHTAAAVLLRSPRAFVLPCPMECSRRPRSKCGRSAIPGLWLNGWSTGSYNHHRDFSLGHGHPWRQGDQGSARPGTAALVASGDLLQLGDVSGTEMSIIVQPVE